MAPTNRLLPQGALIGDFDEAPRLPYEPLPGGATCNRSPRADPVSAPKGPKGTANAVPPRQSANKPVGVKDSYDPTWDTVGSPVSGPTTSPSRTLNRGCVVGPANVLDGDVVGPGKPRTAYLVESVGRMCPDGAAPPCAKHG